MRYANVRTYVGPDDRRKSAINVGVFWLRGRLFALIRAARYLPKLRRLVMRQDERGCVCQPRLTRRDIQRVYSAKPIRKCPD